LLLSLANFTTASCGMFFCMFFSTIEDGPSFFRLLLQMLPAPLCCCCHAIIPCVAPLPHLPAPSCAR
jgi:hypothetical protein